jgi:hypothetical protein
LRLYWLFTPATHAEKRDAAIIQAFVIGVPLISFSISSKAEEFEKLKPRLLELNKGLREAIIDFAGKALEENFSDTVQ